MAITSPTIIPALQTIVIICHTNQEISMSKRCSQRSSKIEIKFMICRFRCIRIVVMARGAKIEIIYPPLHYPLNTTCGSVCRLIPWPNSLSIGLNYSTWQRSSSNSKVFFFSVTASSNSLSIRFRNTPHLTRQHRQQLCVVSQRVCRRSQSISHWISSHD